MYAFLLEIIIVKKHSLSVRIILFSLYFIFFRILLLIIFQNRFQIKYPQLTLFWKMEKQNDASLSLDVHRGRITFANRSILLKILRLFILIILIMHIITNCFSCSSAELELLKFTSRRCALKHASLHWISINKQTATLLFKATVI